jgi:FAD/FMN-containing dehydrogenase
VFNDMKRMTLFRNKDGSIVGGISLGTSVGAAGGWVMGGGHSVFSPKFGLGTSPSFSFIPHILTFDPGVDNVLQFTIVLADGSLITTNSFQYPDLFWALRGSTYGVVTSTTYQTHPSRLFSRLQTSLGQILIRLSFHLSNM